ncbi:hypothetical protein O9992_21280 [Vibrio lentus]|nr:hypothetical protein [Vibrio lentus]
MNQAKIWHGVSSWQRNGTKSQVSVVAFRIDDPNLGWLHCLRLLTALPNPWPYQWLDC